MRALKVLVVVMGVLLVGGTIALIAAVITRTGRQPTPPVAGAPALRDRGGTRTLVDLPPGARVEGTELAGDRLVLRLALPGGGGELILFDARNGARLGTIELRPGGTPEEAKP